jgi:hypothetical protein
MPPQTVALEKNYVTLTKPPVKNSDLFTRYQDPLKHTAICACTDAGGGSKILLLVSWQAEYRQRRSKLLLTQYLKAIYYTEITEHTS